MQRRWRWSILTEVKATEATEETQQTLISRPQPDTHALSPRTTTLQTYAPQHQTPTGTRRPHNTHDHHTTKHHPRQLQIDPCSGKHEHTTYQRRLPQTNEKTNQQAPRVMSPATHFGRKRVSWTGVSYTSQAGGKQSHLLQVPCKADQKRRRGESDSSRHHVGFIRLRTLAESGPLGQGYSLRHRPTAHKTPTLRAQHIQPTYSQSQHTPTTTYFADPTHSHSIDLTTNT